MGYIGKEPVVGNFQVCDAITVVNGQAAYSLTVGSAAVSPESANHMLVSLNGVLQKPGSSFTISGSTMTFASNLATGDVIDFVQILGNVLDLGQPSDDTVKTASIQADAVTEAKIADDAVESEHLNNNIISGQTALAESPADTDEFLVSDGGTIKRIDYSHIKGGGQKTLLSTATVSSAVSEVDITSNIDSTYARYEITVDNLSCATNNAHLHFRIFQSGGLSSSSSYDWVYYYGQSNDSSFSGYARNEGDTYIRLLDEVKSDSDQTAYLTLTLYDPSNTTTHKRIDSINTYSRGGNINAQRVGGRQTETNAVTGVRFFMSSGNIDGGVFKLYGIT